MFTYKTNKRKNMNTVIKITIEDLTKFSTKFDKKTMMF